MNTAVMQAALPDERLEAGAVLLLDRPDTGWIVRSGAIELYASLWQDGAAISGRHYLFTLKAGEFIAPTLCAIERLMLSVVASEAAALFPVPLHFLSEVAGTKERGPVLAAQLDRWIEGLGGTMAAIVGAIPTGAVAHASGEKFAVNEGEMLTGRGTVTWFASTDGAALAYPDGDTVAEVDATQAAPVPPGLWLGVGGTASAFTLDSATVIQDRTWPERLESFHHKVFALLLQHLEAREAAAVEQVQGRAERTSRAL
ncbi:MAG TPA: hypothetical protein VMU42_14295, partial [Candidatus Sulfotelmatobacter sp.]|nr:hypothetical protein [Candidatus Sulfotelmatobacter sp.]